MTLNSESITTQTFSHAPLAASDSSGAQLASAFGAGDKELAGPSAWYSAVWKKNSAEETQVYGWTYEDYRRKYDELWKQGWRLKLLQPYVLSGDRVRYTAVWEQSTAGEIQVYGFTYEDYRKKYDELWKQGWRLKLLQPYVLSGTQVRYTAVWKQSTLGEIQVYGYTYEDYRRKYDELWKQGWRLKLLQPFVLDANQVRYTAVWHPRSYPEIQTYGATYASFRKQYDALWEQGWRLQQLRVHVTSASSMSSELVNRAVNAYQRAGGAAGPLGFPLAPVRVANGTGTWNLSGGHITVSANGKPEVVVDEMVEAWLVGFKCFRESNEISGSDEPYFIVSLVGAGSSATVMHEAKNVDKGDERATLMLLGDSFPVATSVLHVAVCEHDEGSANEARKKVTAAMAEFARAAQQAATAYDAAAAAAGATAGGLHPAADLAGLLTAGPLGKLIARGVVAALGLGDDPVAEDSKVIFDKEHGYADFPIAGHIHGEHYTHKLWLEGKSAGNYEVYVRVHKYGKPRPISID